MSKVAVRIYGQEYRIEGEKNEDEIQLIAQHVDEQMREIGRVNSYGSTSSIAVLAAMNICEEYFDARTDVEVVRTQNEAVLSEIESLRRELSEAAKGPEEMRAQLDALRVEKERLEKEKADVIVELEEARISALEKENEITVVRSEARRTLLEKEGQLEKVQKELDEMKNRGSEFVPGFVQDGQLTFDTGNVQVQGLSNIERVELEELRMGAAQMEELKAKAAQVDELKSKVSEYESTFFDVQMENVKLKEELQKLKNSEYIELE